MLDYEFFYIISIPVYVFFLLFLMWKKFNIKKIVISTLFYFYIVSVIAVTIFPIAIQWLDEIGKYAWNNNNFIPLVSILDILFNNSLGFIIKIKQIIGNIVLFIPMGFLIPIIWKSKSSFKRALQIGILLSFTIELLQYIIWLLIWFNYKVTDLDDILLNTLGFIIGFFFYKIFIMNYVSQKNN